MNFRRSHFANWADLNGEWVDLHETLASSESTFQRNVRVIRKIPVDSDFRSVAPFFEVFSLSFVDSETILWLVYQLKLVFLQVLVFFHGRCMSSSYTPLYNFQFESWCQDMYEGFHMRHMICLVWMKNLNYSFSSSQICCFVYGLRFFLLFWHWSFFWLPKIII